ncbi:hypothetical protein D9M68_595200 [compost metagenome]
MPHHEHAAVGQRAHHEVGDDGLARAHHAAVHAIARVGRQRGHLVEVARALVSLAIGEQVDLVVGVAAVGKRMGDLARHAFGAARFVAHHQLLHAGGHLPHHALLQHAHGLHVDDGQRGQHGDRDEQPVVEGEPEADRAPQLAQGPGHCGAASV